MDGVLDDLGALVEKMDGEVRATVGQALDRYSEHITRVEVHLADESPGKNGQKSHRCMLEARLEGRHPVPAPVIFR